MVSSSFGSLSFGENSSEGGLLCLVYGDGFVSKCGYQVESVTKLC